MNNVDWEESASQSCKIEMPMAYWAVIHDLHARRRKENRILVTGFAPQLWRRMYLVMDNTLDFKLLT